MLTSLAIAFGVNCGGKSSDEPSGGNAAVTGGSSSASIGGSNSAGEEDTGGRSSEAGRTATGGSATGGTEGGQVATGGSAGEDGAAAAAGAHPLTLEGLFQAQCDAASSCCIQKGLKAATGRCRDQFGWGAIEGKLNSGEVVLDPAALEQCIAAYENVAMTCTETGLSAACRGLFAGTKAPGEPCTDFPECDRRDGPVLCKFVGNEPMGTCTPLIHGEEKQPCDQDCLNRAECSGNEGGLSTVPHVYCFEDEGLYCSSEDAPMACRKLRAIGEDCDNGSACGSEGRCKPTSSSAVARSCVLGAGVGEACQTNDRVACADGLWCDGQSEVGTCREYEFLTSTVCEKET